ncbi:MAG UNVERIFIED_CONTAM: hypothetical protein LOD86_10695 [Thermobifida fusca]
MGKTKTQMFDPGVLGVFRDPSIPETPLQALMEAAPYAEPEESWEEKQERYEALRDALDTVLDDRERWVIEAMFWRRMGIKRIGRELNYSPTHIARIRDTALRKLREHFGDAVPPTGGTDLDGDDGDDGEADDMAERVPGGAGAHS